MPKSPTPTLYTGDVWARLELAKATLYPAGNPLEGEGIFLGESDAAGSIEPVIYGVVIADRGTHYTYTRGDRGGLAETVEAEALEDVQEPAPIRLVYRDLDGNVVDGDDSARNCQMLSVGIAPEEPAPAPKPQAEYFRRRFDQDLAKALRREGVTVPALAEHLGAAKKSMYSVLSGIKPHGVMARARFDKLAAFKMREQEVPTVGIAANLGANVNSLHAFFDRVPPARVSF